MCFRVTVASLALLSTLLPAGGAAPLRLATYNVENYLLMPMETRSAKEPASRAKIAEVVASLQADLLALQEVSGLAALEDIQKRVRARGIDYPHRELVRGWDTNIQVALLSRYPIIARRPHTRDAYLLAGRRFRVSRGILEADVQVGPDYVLTVFVVHLKSRRPIPEADESEMRREEARILREKIELRLRENRGANVIVLGDLNDTKDSEAVRLVIGRGRHQMVDARPAERNGDTGFTPNPRWEPRNVTWTHYYGVEDTYGRIDYILLHPNAAREWIPKETWIPSIPDWGMASDHRPIVVGIEPVNR
jgi:endonuclease/exonuclease/phosphatase family metal-dependent hydrolase